MLTCQVVEKSMGHLIPTDSRGHEQESYQCNACVSVNLPTGKTPEPGKKEKEPLAINALESKEDFQYVKLTVSKTIVALR